jgi:hypothetical protein
MPRLGGLSLLTQKSFEILGRDELFPFVHTCAYGRKEPKISTQSNGGVRRALRAPFLVGGGWWVPYNFVLFCSVLVPSFDAAWLLAAE